MKPLRYLPALMAAFVAMPLVAHTFDLAQGNQASTQRPPTFQVDPKWPTIPNNWVLGEVSSIAVGPQDHIWVLHRPRSIPAEKRANAAPAVLEFDTSGKLLASWGGPGEGYDWPEREHGIYVDAKGFVWIGGNGGWPKPSAEGNTDDMILKFTPAGKLVMQIGRRGQGKGNTDTSNVRQPADLFVHTPTNELFVADGYGNQRIVVFDADSGKFKRMWGAYGNTPPAAMTPNPAQSAPPETPSPQQFGLVHAVKVSNDGIVYVADRTYRRLQTFTLDGKFIREVKLTPDPKVAPVPAGFAFSADPKQQFLYVVDSGPMRVVIFDRASMTQIGSLGMRGPNPGDFDIVHHMAADSKGNLYTAEIVTNRRAQRFVLQPTR
jgi:DNA-binding beta-propeller fold protein YncE